MSQNGHPSSVKSLIIVILLIIVGIQAYLLWREHPHEGQAPAPGKSVEAPVAPSTPSGPAAPVAVPAKAASGKPVAVEAVSFQQRRDEIFIAFNRPIGEEESSGDLVSPPFDTDPPVPGQWNWMGPYVLRFKTSAKNAFDPALTYTFTARPERFLPSGETLAGRTVFDIKGSALRLFDWSSELDPVPGKPGWYTVVWELRLNRTMRPQDALAGFRLVDPKLGEAAPVALSSGQDPEEGSSTLRLVSAPVQADTKARTFTLLGDKDKVAAVDGTRLDQPLVLTASVVHSAVLDVRLSKKRDRDRDLETAGFLFTFSARTDPEEFKRVARVEPPVENLLVTAEPGSGLLVSGAFKPGASYSLTLPKGLTSLSGATLDKDAKFTLRVPDLEPSAKFAHQGMFLPRSGARNLAIESVNVNSAQVRIDRVYRNNVFFALNYYDYSFYNDQEYMDEVLPYLGDTVDSFDMALKSPRNQTRQTPFNLEEHVRDHEPGLYRVMVSAEGRNGNSGQKWMLVTDLGIAAKRGRDDMLVWVASYKDAAPVAGARVKIVSTKNQVLYQGVTDAKGLWRVTGLSKLPEDKELFMITAEKDADYSFLQLARMGTDMTGLDVSGVEVAQAGYQAFLWGERDIYRPGETASGMVAVRDPKLGTPQPVPLKLRWSDPQGRELAVDTVKTDAQGLAAFTRTMPAHSPTGPYLLEALVGDEPIGQYRFQVEDFKPDRIATEVKPETERASPGKDLSYAVVGRYLFGAPAAGLAVETQVTLTPAPFAPKGFETYTFGDPDRTFDPVDLFHETGQLDDEGRMVFKAAVPEGLKPPAALVAVVSGRVSEAGGRGVAARVKMLVDAYPRYPGILKLNDSGLKPGEPHAFEYVVVDGLGQEAKAESLVAELYQDRWQTVLKRTGEGTGFKYETKRDSRLVERREIADPGSRGQVSFTPPKYGSYRLVVKEPSTGAAAQLSFWAEGQGYNPWAMENPAKLEFASAKQDYLPGETARLQVRAPFAGKLLLTVESLGVMDTMIVDMPANTGEVSVPIKPGYSPNVYVTGVLVRKGADVRPGETGRAFGTISLGVAREAGRQKVSVLAPEQIRPQTPLTITAKADPGSIVTLAAVDEGILQLIAQKTPDPWGAFYAKRGLGVASFDTWAMLLPEVKAAGAKAPAGGDDWSRYLRTESPQGDKSVAFWSGPLKADAQGRVQWTIDVPGFQGALRIMAVAVSGNRFGSAQHITRVRSPLVLLPTFPRFAQTGETLRLPVTLRNDTGADGSFALAFEASGAVSVAKAPAAVDIPAGKERTVFLGVKTSGSEGTAALAVKASGNNESMSARTEFFVRSPLPAESRIQDGTNQGQTVEFPAADAQGLLSGTVARSLRAGRFPAVRYAGKLDALLGYPYGCMEQTVSKAFPLLYLANLARELEPEALAKSSPEAMAQQGVTRVLSMQLPSGGFGMWPGSDREQEWATVYGTHFLLEASKGGYQVQARALESSLAFIADAVKNEHHGGGLKTQAYGLYVLARAGKADRGMMDHMRDKLAAKLTADAKALLAAAYTAAGNAKGGEKLLAGLGEPVAAPRADDIFDSPLRARALMLSALADADPAGQETAKAARELTRMLDSAKACSTQESGMAFMALGKLFARQQAAPPCGGQLMAGQTQLARFDTSKTFVLKNIGEQGALTLALGPECQPGALFYTLDTRGIPELASYKAASAGLAVSREFLGRDGKPLDASRLAQGAVVVVKTSVKSLSGALAHVVVSQLLPSGLEVENPRLASTDRLPWMAEEPAPTAYADFRADRVNVFLDLPGDKPVEIYTLCRAVIPGDYTLPPVRAEAMYYPEIFATAGLGTLKVEGGGD
ncbi:alpha-2-macroglobulin family protein [Fundidesulfovibrio terrae]|uniref:alpha-2-macroglobulin family protein n=1 Tax=Fundidesulfovibrio terrae TaxID=2922866 RepID=UPI001FAF8CBA|nr:MG2 domain-containing protein [Fundidesulfovibrio terrae]